MIIPYQKELEMEIVRSLSLFVLAGLCEIGGGYPVWIWLRYEKSVLFETGFLCSWSNSGEPTR
ncbi:MAG: hypothetical protein A2157_10270 [Deltaproteobacteria bacterium RBG_16_47_11]|nr:MAG: hypothetical protein A2157_10270 [Deltaproteobacteria bacterium RBG_16_47_11]